MYLEETAASLMKRYATLFPWVALTGPRQSGKSTLVRHVFPDVAYVTFDDPDEELALATDPKGFLARHTGQVIFDKVQPVPILFRYLKNGNWRRAWRPHRTFINVPA